MSLQDRIALTRAVMHLLDSWGMRPAEQVSVLGLPESTRPRTLRRYHEDTPLPEAPEVARRLEHLVGIADALRTMYPGNAQMGAVWMNRTNRHFPRRSPRATIVERGLSGLVQVRAHLDCTFAWDLTGSSA